MIITNHACERFLERELGYITWTMDYIIKARNYLKTFVCKFKHKNLYNNAKEKLLYVLVDKLVLIFNQTKEVLITLYPFSENKLDYFEHENCKQIPLPKKYQILKTSKGKYPEPNLLSISITETKNKIHITVNDRKKPYNPSGCFETICKAEKFISDYTKFYNSNFVIN